MTESKTFLVQNVSKNATVYMRAFDDLLTVRSSAKCFYIKPGGIFVSKICRSQASPHVYFCLLQELMIGEALSLAERKRKNSGVKEMLHDATKLTHKLRFLVEEVRHSPCV